MIRPLFSFARSSHSQFTMTSTICRMKLQAFTRLRPLETYSLSRRAITTAATSTTGTSQPRASSSQQLSHSVDSDRPTHFKITLRRSAISLGDKIKATIESLGIHRRFQTVYFPHSPEVAGKILRLKELVEVEN